MASLKAIIFDQDGVLADTERDGHRVAFNKAFAEFGLGIEWDVPTYGALLSIGGGKERMRHHFRHLGSGVKTAEAEALIPQLHERKTAIFADMIERGMLSLRPGVERLVREAHAAGIRLAVCSTSNEKAVHTLVKTLLGADAYGWFDAILAGDVVKTKKPDPLIYKLALERLTLRAEECVVVEDNRNGLKAATGAGIRCLVTVNEYTAGEDFHEAAMVVTCLGDDRESARILQGTPAAPFNGTVSLALLRSLVT